MKHKAVTKAVAKAARKSSGRMSSKGFPNPIDVYLGDKMRQRRKEIGVSQELLAKHTDLTFQQIQKYERGANRMSASRMVDLAHALHVTPTWFFEDLPPDIMKLAPSMLNGAPPPILDLDKGLRRFDMDTMRHFKGMTAELRDVIGRLVRGLVKHDAVELG